MKKILEQILHHNINGRGVPSETYDFGVAVKVLIKVNVLWTLELDLSWSRHDTRCSIRDWIFIEGY